MHSSQHPYRIHTSTAANQSPTTLPSSPTAAVISNHKSSTLPSSFPASASSSSSPVFYHPHPSHLTTHASPDPTTISFSVMQYNILAGPLATSEHFPFAMPHLLDWSYRRQAIVRKIKEMMSPPAQPATASSSAPISSLSASSASSYSPSTDALPTFLCFQELTDYWTYFEPELAALGYKGIYIKRPSLHMSNWSGTEKHDGCMLAYRASMVKRVVDVDAINYDDSHDRVGLVVLLEWAQRVEGVCPYVLLGTTHLYWDHRLLAVQVNELDQLLESVRRMQRKHESELMEDGKVVGPIPTVLSGDFNNGPSSQIYSRVVDQHTFHPITTTSSGSNTSNGTADPHYLYRYESSYAQAGMEPACTTATHRRCWTIDYIFYSLSAAKLPTSTSERRNNHTLHSSHHDNNSDQHDNGHKQLLRVTHTNPLPSEAELRSEPGPAGWNSSPQLQSKGHIQQGIPNSKQPSDHVPLFARFEVVRRSGESNKLDGGDSSRDRGSSNGGHNVLDKS